MSGSHPQGWNSAPHKDLDIVLIIEVLTPEAIKTLRVFIAEGGYEIRQRTEGSPVLYRFAKPKNDQFPFMLELFSRRPEGLQLDEDQEITPIPAGTDHHSLSPFSSMRITIP